jgi:hypothetical protein
MNDTDRLQRSLEKIQGMRQVAFHDGHGREVEALDDAITALMTRVYSIKYRRDQGEAGRG